MTGGSILCWPFVVALAALWSSCQSSILKETSLKSSDSSYGSNSPHHQSRMQVFVQTPTELRLVIDGLAIQSAADLVDYALLNGVPFQNPPLRFDPGAVDFGETEFAAAAQRRVTVHNPSNAVVHLLTITGSTAHYHCSFFEDNILFPGANTSFDVYFLPRERGNLSSVLEIHTSIGIFALNLRGIGVESRFHLLPAISMKLPTNTTFIYLMSLNNPFPKDVQITEIFTSSAELHVELVTGNSDEDADLWHLRPYETRPIFFLEFKGREAAHFIAYVVIMLKVYGSEGSDIEKLFIPVDFEITEGVGLFPTSPVVDFGVVSPSTPTVTMPLKLWNGYYRPVLIQNVTLLFPNPAVSVEYLPVRLAQDYIRQQTVAHVTLNASLLTSRSQLNGDISVTVKGNQNNTAVIPYRIKYVSGTLQALSSSNLSFNCQEGHCDWHTQPRSIPIVNQAKSQITLYAITMKPCEPRLPYNLFLEVKRKRLPAIFAANQSHQDLFTLNVKKVSSEDSKTVRCGVLLSTSTGIVELPINIWDGKLEVRYHFVPLSNFLDHDVSLIYTGNEDGPVTRTLSLLNPNPVVVKTRKFDAISPYVFAHVLGISKAIKGNVYTLADYHSFSEVVLPTGEVPIPPSHFAVVEFYVNATEPPAFDSLNNILMWVNTDQPNRTPIVGSILFDNGNFFSHPDPIIFRDCFPGRLSSEDLVMSHTYRVSGYNSDFEDESNPYHLQFLDFFPDQTGITYSMESSYVFFEEKTKIAKITYDPSASCGDSCYVGLSDKSPLHAHWLSSCNLDTFSADIDSYLLHQLRQRWQRLKSAGKDIVNVTIAVLTSELIEHLAMPHQTFMQAQLSIPRLIYSTQPILTFSIVEVGQFDILNFTVANPSNKPLAIQLVLLEAYSAAFNRPIPSLLGNTEYARSAMNGLKTDKDAFSFLDLNFTINFNMLISRNRNNHARPFPAASRCSKRSLTAVLRPYTNFTVHIRFSPSEAREYKSIVILRNNLTFLETIPIRGQGGQGDLLLFDSQGQALDKVELLYTYDKLADCLKDHSAIGKLFSMFYSWFYDDPPEPFNVNETLYESPYGKLPPLPNDPPFTMRRALVLRNMGRLPVYITSVAVFGMSPGLRLDDISGTKNHVIPSNGTVNFLVSFAPDFNNYRYLWTLVVNSTSGTIKYPIIALFPPHLISVCQSALPRPEWESALQLTVIFIVAPNIIGALLFALCDAYHVTSVVRQINAHLARQQQPVSPRSSHSSQHRGMSHSGRHDRNKNEASKNIKIHLEGSQASIGTVISESKFSRNRRIVIFIKATIGKALSFLWNFTGRPLFSRLLPSKVTTNDSKRENGKSHNGEASKTIQTQNSSDNSRIKGQSRNTRLRGNRLAGFRRLYGQLIPSNPVLDMEISVNERAPKLVEEMKPLRKKPTRPSKTTTANELLKEKRHSSSQMSDIKLSSVPDDVEIQHQLMNKESDDEFADDNRHPTDFETNIDSLVGNDGRLDGQSADDECSSADSEEEGVGDGENPVDDDDNAFELKTSVIAHNGHSLTSSTSDEEHYSNGKQSSTSSIEMSGDSNSHQTTSKYTSMSSRQFHKHLPNRYQQNYPHGSNTGLQNSHPRSVHGEWHSRKQQRLSEQPPRLQRRIYSNNTPDRSPQRPNGATNGSIRLNNVKEVTAVASVPSKSASPLVFSQGTDPSSAPSRPANTPYSIAEATMNRVLGSHTASHKSATKVNLKGNDLPISSSLPSKPVFSSPWATSSTLAIQNKGPSIADAVILSAAQAAQQQNPTPNPKLSQRPFELVTPSTFSPASATFVPSAAAKRLVEIPNDKGLNAPSVTPSSIPALQFAESLLDEPESAIHSPNTDISQNLPNNVANANPWSWEVDSIWNAQSLESASSTSWDPWAAQIMKSFWGPSDDRKGQGQDKK